MKKITTFVVMVAVVASMAVFALPAAAEELLPSNIGSYKFYDTDMDGIYDMDEEYGIEGWRIELWQDGALVRTTLSDPITGWWRFKGLLPGTYEIRESVPKGCSCWVQTAPSPPNYFTIDVIGDGYIWECETRFGNVCKRCVKGYTMGFWGNKNGLKLLNEYAGLDGMIDIPKYGPMSVADIQAMANDADAVDMCDMLKAQYVAHWLSVNVKGADYGGAGVILAPGELKDYDEAMAEFAVFDCSTATRHEAEAWKNFFDGLNNNWFPVVEYFENMCPVPTCWK